MADTPPPDDDYLVYDDEDDSENGCVHCGFQSWIILCPDDMCRGSYDGGPWAPCGKSKCVRPCDHCNKSGAAGF